jgi:hypothetical protein
MQRHLEISRIYCGMRTGNITGNIVCDKITRRKFSG